MQIAWICGVLCNNGRFGSWPCVALFQLQWWKIPSNLHIPGTTECGSLSVLAGGWTTGKGEGQKAVWQEIILCLRPPAPLPIYQMSLKWMFKTCAQPTKCERQSLLQGFGQKSCCWPPQLTGMPMPPRPFRQEETWSFSLDPPLLDHWHDGAQAPTSYVLFGFKVHGT